MDPLKPRDMVDMAAACRMEKLLMELLNLGSPKLTTEACAARGQPYAELGRALAKQTADLEHALASGDVLLQKLTDKTRRTRT
jgi:hypothetical protein